MSAPASVGWCERVNPAIAFLAMAALTIVGGGATAAAMAHAPSRKLFWAVAYLVLVVGVTQALLGLGQALLAARQTAVSVRLVEWLMFNLGSAGVICGTLWPLHPLVLAGTVLLR